MITELQTFFDSRQSFYGKAQIETTQNKNVLDFKLFSYGVFVARVTQIGNTKQFFYFGKYSQTTTRHQKEFFKQHGLNDKELKELFKNGTLEKEER